MAHAKYDLWPDDWPIVFNGDFSLCYSWPEGTVPTSNNLSSFRSFSQQSPKSKLQVLQVLLIDVLHKFFVVFADSSDFMVRFQKWFYPLVNIQKTMETWPFSIAMLNYQRVMYELVFPETIGWLDQLGAFPKKMRVRWINSATKEIWLLAQDQQPNKEDV